MTTLAIGLDSRQRRVVLFAGFRKLYPRADGDNCDHSTASIVSRMTYSAEAQLAVLA